jgi:hypothetical protein
VLDGPLEARTWIEAEFGTIPNNTQEIHGPPSLPANIHRKETGTSVPILADRGAGTLRSTLLGRGACHSRMDEKNSERFGFEGR